MAHILQGLHDFWSVTLSPVPCFLPLPLLLPIYQGAGPAGCIAYTSLLAAVQFLWAFERHLWTGGQGKEKPDKGLLCLLPVWSCSLAPASSQVFSVFAHLTVLCLSCQGRGNLLVVKQL